MTLSKKERESMKIQDSCYTNINNLCMRGNNKVYKQNSFRGGVNENNTGLARFSRDSEYYNEYNKRSTTIKRMAAIGRLKIRLKNDANRTTRQTTAFSNI